jgi:hypothetical protein
MSEDFKKGDRVIWKSHGGNAEGDVLQKITDDSELAGRKVRASTDIRSTSCAATRAAVRQCTNLRR